jgi:3-oxoacyl-[acyl-carrier protein] reductase
MERMRREEGDVRLPPLGRFGRAAEVGDAVAFLMSDRAAYITGACIDVSGGSRLH